MKSKKQLKDEGNARKIADRLMGRDHRLVKNTRPMTGQYVYREVGYNKSCVANLWYAYCAPANINLPKGLQAKTARKLMELIDQHLDVKHETAS